MTTTKRYSIERLLMDGAQPFDNLDAEQYDDLRYDIASKGKRLDTMPVHLSADDVLYDGHQRLRILLELGKKTIGESEIIRNTKIKGRRAAYMEAIKINRQRRHLTGEAMAKVIWDLVQRYGMSQNNIGKEIGMTQQSVSELMKKYPPADLPDSISTLGADGKTYVRKVSRDNDVPEAVHVMPKTKTPPAPWQYGGKGSDAVARLRQLLAGEAVVNLDRWEMGQLRDGLVALKGDIDRFLTGLAEHLDALYPDA